jgi:hypothetical protein
MNCSQLVARDSALLGFVLCSGLIRHQRARLAEICWLKLIFHPSKLYLHFMGRNENIIVFRQFDTVVDAHIAQAKLDAFDVPCFLTEEHIASLYPGQQALPFRIRLHIFERDRDRVSQLLTVMTTADPEITCPQCHGKHIERRFPKSLSERTLSALAILFFGVFLPHLKVNHCSDCDNEF